MKWVTGDGAVQIDAIFSEGELAIEGNVREGKDLTDAIKASYQLVGHLSRVNPSGSGRARRVLLAGPRLLAPQLTARAAPSGVTDFPDSPSTSIPAFYSSAVIR